MSVVQLERRTLPLQYPLFEGKVSPGLNTGEIARAYKSWNGQWARCRKKGLKVEYSSREFISWWVVEIKKRKSWQKPTCGRIDHSKGYSFDNIEIQEASDNLAERNTRYTRPTNVLKNGKIVFRAKSVMEAARFAKVRYNNISATIQGKDHHKSLGGFTFQYA